MQDDATRTGPKTSDRTLASLAISPSSLGRTAGMLITVLSLIGLPISSFLVPPAHRTSSYLMTGVSVVIGVFAWTAPWDRWPGIATITLPISSLGFIAGGIYFANRPESFALFFVVVFAWIGVAYPPGTSTYVGPLGILAWVLPIVARGGGTREAILAVYYVPAAVLTGEVLAWLAQRLRMSEARLRRLDELKNEFIGMVAHDMRTPIVVIRGFAERIREDGAEITAAQRDEYLRTIERNAKRASEFVENLLQFARIETEEFHQMVRPFDLGGLAARIADDLLTVQRESRVINVRVDDHLEKALGDEDRNAQVISNLLSNALRFSPPTEVIDLDVFERNGMLHLAVHDRGPGIHPDDMKKLFAKFSTLEPNDDVKRAAGTGLGLYISRRIVEAQGGEIWADSTPGGGTTFHYTVPATTRSQTAASQVVSPPLRSGVATPDLQPDKGAA
jgi:signal transduction histidine kinase